IGIAPGQPAVEAEALAENAQRSGRVARGAVFIDEDTDADREGLRELADRCRILTPLVGCSDAEFPGSLLLDLTGCAASARPPRELAEAIRQSFEPSGLQGRIVLAPGIHAAWALACLLPFETRRFARGFPLPGIPPDCAERATEQSGRQDEPPPSTDAHFLPHPRWPLLATRDWPTARRLLTELPIAALRLDPKTEAILEELGLITIGTLLEMPRTELRRRMGKQLVERLQTLMGERPEIFPALPERPDFTETQQWDFPVVERSALQTHLRHALDRVVERLRAAGQTTDRYRIELFLDNGETACIPIELAAPTLAPSRIHRVLALKLETIRPPAGVQGLKVSAPETRPIREEMRGLFAQLPASDEHSLRDLADELVGRLGPTAVCRFVPADTHVPEKAYRPVDLLGDVLLPTLEQNVAPSERSTDPEASPPPLRPLIIYPSPLPMVVIQYDHQDRPLRFRCRRRRFVAMAWSSEESLQAEWWTETPIDRRYFRLQTADGRCLWVFRSGSKWFLHGEFA
ncbi:MAG: DNA polymerase Y family protein, partial [Planctomycetota bacterium]